MIDDPDIDTDTDPEYLLALAEERSIEMEHAYLDRRRERRREYCRQLCERLRAQIERLCVAPFSWQVKP